MLCAFSWAGWKGGGIEEQCVSTGALPLKLCEGAACKVKKQAVSLPKTKIKRKGKRMGRKRRFSKILLYAAMLSTIGAGVLGSVPLSVKAAEEEETYTVTFEAYEGSCDTESVSVPKGESIILPDAVYEGHYLHGWVDILEEDGRIIQRTIGVAGSEYTPERSLLLHAHWKPDQEQDITVTYEAKIGDTSYEELEEAFANAQAGDTIVVLKDCSVSATLEITADNITLKSEDAENPVTISRGEDFAGKSYGTNADTVLLAMTGGSLTTQDIIFDGGAVLDEGFNNAGKVWNSPLIYVDGSYVMEGGTVLQNNYNNGYDGTGYRMYHTAGAVHIAQNGNFAMDGGLIQNCYTSGAGGGIQSEKSSHMSATSGTVKNCYATWGGGMLLEGEAELSGMTVSGNSAGSTGGGIYTKAPCTITDTLIEGNYSAYDGGGICTYTGHRPKFIRCTFTGNIAGRGSAIQTLEGEGTDPLEIHDCTFTGNLSEERSYAGGTICYMNETGIILAGKIVMEDNLTLGVEPCDILFFYNTGASILLDKDFESDSTFVLGGFTDVIKPGRVLIDGVKYHKDADPEQFPWHCPNYCTEKRGENLYLAERPRTYFITYDVNNNPDGASDMCSDPNLYTSEDVVTIMGREELFPLMGNIVHFGYNFVGWNTEPDGTGTDYAPGQEISLTDNLYLYAKWEEKEPVTLTYIYNDEEGMTDSTQVIPGANIAFPDASRKGYSFKGWYEDEGLTVFAGNAGEKYYAPHSDTVYYAAWEKTEVTITFDADGGEMEGGDITAKIGDTITLPNCTKDDYEFVGWYDGDTCIGQAGEEYTVDCLTDRHGSLTAVMPRSRQRLLAGITVRGKDETLTEEIRRIASCINEKLGFLGLWYFQIKKDVHGKFKLLEVSARCAGSMCLSRALGVNLPLLSVYAACGRSIEVIQNPYHVMADRTLLSRYRIDYIYDRVYMDLDDTLIIQDKVCLPVIRFVYQCRNCGIPVCLLTRHNDSHHDSDTECLSRHAVSTDLFEQIISLGAGEEKPDYIKPEGSIFIDNSYQERKKVFDRHHIPVFDVEGMEVLADWRS